MATGKYHKHNYLKLLIFEELWKVYPKGLTSRELAEILELDKNIITSRLSHYKYYGYIGKREINDPNMPNTKRKAYRWRINVLGIGTYIKLKGLHGLGKELNLRKLQRGQNLDYIDSYTGKRANIHNSISEKIDK